MTKANTPYRTKAEAIHQLSKLDGTSVLWPEDAFNILHPFRRDIASDGAAQDFEQDLEVRTAIARECQLEVDTDLDLGVKPWESVIYAWRVSLIALNATSEHTTSPADGSHSGLHRFHVDNVLELAEREDVELHDL